MTGVRTKFKIDWRQFIRNCFKF